MSRFAIAFTLVASLTTTTFGGGFAAAPPPDEFRAPVAIELQPNDMPMRMLDKETVRAKLLENRKKNLASFRAYQAKRVFPQNTYRRGRLNVWIDEAQHLCAAATIISMSGAVDLVQRVGEQTNFIRFADVKQGPLMDWILTSGFTQEELVAIQAPFVYMPGEEERLREQEEAETNRLAKIYKRVDRSIVKNQKKSLDRAVERLMKHPELAWKLIDG